MSDTVSAARVSELIGYIYDCAVDPGRWEFALGRITSDLGFHSALLSAISFRPVQIQLSVASGVAPDWLPKLQNYSAAAVDTYGGPQRILDFPLDEPILQSQVTDRESLAANAWFKDYLEPQGLVDSATVFFARDSNSGGCVGFGLHKSYRAIDERQLAVLRLLGPHFRRAIAISRLLDMGSVFAATFARTLDSLASGVLLVDGQLKVLHANLVASAMLEAGDPVRLVAGSLTFQHPFATQTLAGAVARCAGAEHDLGRRGIGVPLKRMSGEPCVAHVLPLQVGEIRPGLHVSAAAAIFIAPAGAPPQLPGDALALLYDLTPAETRVFEQIASGDVPATIASRLGITPATVKTHLLRVFQKTGCNRQAEIVKLAGSLVMPY